MNCQAELLSGLKMMKFSLNHSFKFNNYRIAFFAGLMQAVMVIAVESVNFLVILSATAVLDTVMNFMALVTISEFDNFFYSALGDDDTKDMLDAQVTAYDDLFKITRNVQIP